MSEKFCRGEGKICYRSLRAAKVGARLVAHAMLKRKQIVEDLYAYECKRCDEWHLTRRASWDGKPHIQVFIAAPAEMQRWAMGGER